MMITLLLSPKYYCIFIPVAIGNPKCIYYIPNTHVQCTGYNLYYNYIVVIKLILCEPIWIYMYDMYDIYYINIQYNSCSGDIFFFYS